MKKLVLVLVCALIMVVFIAFNYLLWDNGNKDKDIENLKYLNVSNNSRINAYEMDIKNLQDENKQLKEKISQLEDNVKILENDKLQAENDKSESDAEILEKDELINLLKQSADLKPAEDNIRKWAEAMQDGAYETAYSLQNSEITGTVEGLSFTEFSNRCKNTFKSIKVKSIKLYVDEAGNSRKGDIIFYVALEINKVEDMAEATLNFDEGVNERYFTFQYNAEKGSWLISGITLSP